MKYKACVDQLDTSLIYNDSLPLKWRLAELKLMSLADATNLKRAV